jgi:type II restriction enzyme
VLPSIAIQGQIRLIDQGVALKRATTRNAFARLERLSSLPPADRTWAATTLRITERLPVQFTLQDMYAFEPELEKSFPKNKHIRPKIRQQLQVLRDAGFIIFWRGGRYERIATE